MALVKIYCKVHPMAVFRRVWLLRRNGILEFIRWLVRIPWLEVAVLTNSSLTTSGFAESFLSNPEVSKIICSWVNLKCFRVTSLKDTSCRGTIWTFWNLEKQKKEKKYPWFKLWSLTRDMKLPLLHIVRFLRSRNFKLFVESLEEMASFFFAPSFFSFFWRLSFD